MDGITTPDRQIRILQIEDNAADARLISELLADCVDFSVQMHQSATFTDGCAYLDTHQVDVVLLDLGLPDSSGLATLKKMKNKFPLLPTVILTGLDDDQMAVEALRHGAQDYIGKNEITSRLLRRVIRYAIERKQLESERERLLPMLEATRNELHVFDSVTLRYIYGNPCALENSGYSLEQLCQLTPFNLVPGLTPESFAELSAPLRNGDCSVVRVETSHRRADGTIYPVETHLQLLKAQSRSYFLAVIFDISERKQTHEQLERMAHEWQTTFDAITDSVSLISAEQRIIRCNKATAELCGRAFPDIIGRNCWEVIHGTSEPLAECPMTRSLQTGKTETMTFQRDGRWMDVTVDPIRGDDGVLTGAVHVVRDVTNNKILEQTQLFLLHSGNPGQQEEFFTALARYLGDTLDMFFVCIDRLLGDGLTAETVAVYVDGQFEDNVSYALKDTPCGDVVGKTICCFPRDVRGLFPKDDVLQEMMAESYVGTTLWSSQGVPIGLIAIIGRQSLHNTELAEAVLKLVAIRAAGELERRQAEAALQKSLALLAVTASAAKMGGWEIDLSSNTLTWTDETYRIYEVEPDFKPTVEGTIAYYAPESIPVITMAVQRAMESGEPFDLELYLITAKGNKRLVHAVGQAEFKDGNPTKVFGTFQDIHAQRLTDQQLKEALAQVIQQEKLATIGQLAAGVAHEINNPVGFIKSNLVSLEKYTLKIFDYLAREKELADRYLPKTEHAELVSLWRSLKLDFICEDIQDLIHESQEGTDRVRKIVQDLVSFSRKQGDELVPVDINSCLESTLAIAWNEIKHQAELRSELTPVPAVMANSQKLTQVFLNLLMNAAHALSQGGLITLRTWQEGDSVCIAVADNGCGIPLEIRDMIFEPFYTTKEAGKGTGLGLAISRDMVAKFGGSIQLESEVGVGTTFTVRLPVAGPAEPLPESGAGE